MTAAGVGDARRSVKVKRGLVIFTGSQLARVEVSRFPSTPTLGEATRLFDAALADYVEAANALAKAELGEVELVPGPGPSHNDTVGVCEYCGHLAVAFGVCERCGRRPVPSPGPSHNEALDPIGGEGTWPDGQPRFETKPKDLESEPHVDEPRNQWQCPLCQYFNAGPVCTHCGQPRPRIDLTHAERAMLFFEKRFENRAPDGSKQQAMWDQLGLTPTSYAQRLNRLLDNPMALAAEPVLINRLRRVRDAGVAARSS